MTQTSRRRWQSFIYSFRSFFRVTLVLAVSLAGALVVQNMVSAAAPIVVRPSNMQGWAFFDDNGNGGSYGMVSGPGAPPLGVGSANLAVVNTSQGVALGTHAYQGTRLDYITTLTYSSYRISGGSALAGSLGFDIDYDVTDTNTAYQGRLTFEPYYTNTVVTGAWQTWNTLTSTGTGNWWATGAPGNTMCPIGNPCTWSEVLTDFPNAGMRTPGTLLFKAGSGWASFDGNVDALVIGVYASNTAYDFEPDLDTPTPTSTPTATPTPMITPLSVGGISLDPQLPGSSGGNSGLLAGVIAGAMAVAVALSGGVWYSRRRRAQ
jgi:hypothetical protein